MKEKYLCKDLYLSIWVEEAPQADLVKIQLANQEALDTVEITTKLGPELNTPNRSYHLREAIVIALRRVVSQAMIDGLISVSRGLSAQSGSTTRLGAKNITLSIPPES